MAGARQARSGPQRSDPGGGDHHLRAGLVLAGLLPLPGVVSAPACPRLCTGRASGAASCATTASILRSHGQSRGSPRFRKGCPANAQAQKPVAAPALTHQS